MADDLKESVAAKTLELPHEPGVYLFKDQKGEVIYVGKALDLRQRVRSYFQKSAQKSTPPSPRLARLESVPPSPGFPRLNPRLRVLVERDCCAGFYCYGYGRRGFYTGIQPDQGICSPL
ncbi:MAG: GIY-YIG nuclease family protein [Dethiobacteria bacterium]